MKFQIDQKILKDSLKFQLQKAIAEAVNSVKGPTLYRVKPGEVHLEHPENEEFGDYATNVALKLKAQSLELKVTAKSVKLEKFKTPMDLAEAIVRELRDNEAMKQLINKIEAVKPGFINITIKHDWLIREPQRVIEEGDDYGRSQIGMGRKIVIEHTSPNIIKKLHIGHVRNNVLAMAVSRILKNLGCQVILDCINNDRGIHICKAMWAYLAYGKKNSRLKIENFDWYKTLEDWYKKPELWLTHEDENLKPDHFVDKFYVLGVKNEENPENKKEMRQILQKWEADDKIIHALWKKLTTWVYQGFAQTYKRLGSHHDKNWYESKLYKKGKQIVFDGLKKGVFKKLKDGAILTNLEKYNLPDKIVIRSDGTSLYEVFDFNLTKKKREEFNANFYIWVIGPEQTLYLKQLFAICEQLGIGRQEEYLHLSYGMVYLKGKGKMSSREGTVVAADDLIDLVIKKARQVRLASLKGKTGKGERWLDEIIGLAALKYTMLKNNRLSDIYFDPDESISLEGNSGPYLQYTYARCQSVLTKASQGTTPGVAFSLSRCEGIGEPNPEELAILRTLYKFPEVVFEAGEQFAPNIICSFLYDLAQKYNAFYNKYRILNPQLNLEENSSQSSENCSQLVRAFRLLLTAATAQVLKNGLRLLGIKAVEKM